MLKHPSSSPSLCLVPSSFTAPLFFSSNFSSSSLLSPPPSKSSCSGYELNLIDTSINRDKSWLIRDTASVLWPPLVRPTLFLLLLFVSCRLFVWASWLLPYTAVLSSCRWMFKLRCAQQSALGIRRCWLHKVHYHKKSVTIPLEFPSLLCNY